MNTKRKLIQEIVARLAQVYEVQQREIIAWWIVEFITKKEKAQLLQEREISLTKSQEELLDRILVEHIEKHKPLQYIFGSVPFLDLTILVKPPVLIPRPETEYWCSLLIKKLALLKNKKLTILDLCTGTGCIGLALAHRFSEATVYAIDINPIACKLAQENKELNNISNLIILESNLYNKLPDGIKFDLIVANPPYIDPNEWETLDLIVKKWEDPLALKSENAGYGLIEEIITYAPNWLACNSEMVQELIPQVCIEIGVGQCNLVKKIFENNEFNNCAVITDLGGIERVVTAGLTQCGYVKNKTIYWE